MAWNGNNFNGVPGDAELWRIGDESWLVYRVPGGKAKLGYQVQGDDIQALFGPEDHAEVEYDRSLDSMSDARGRGMLDMGVREQLANDSEHPFRTFESQYEREAQVRPWMRDPEVLALISSAHLQGRQVTEAELQSTDWWQHHNEREREWLLLSESDPRSAEYQRMNNRYEVEQALVDAGIRDYSDELVDFINERYTAGVWSPQAVQQHINRLADPHAPGDIHPDLEPFLEQIKTTEEGENEVRQIIREWLGPGHAEHFDENTISTWAGRLRNEPDAHDRLVRHLRNHRMALFPEYEDDTLTYEDIVGPWRGVVTQYWGQQPDEVNDNTLTKIARMNDMEEARKHLMREGLKRNNETVMSDIFSRFGRAIEGPVQHSVV